MKKIYYLLATSLIGCAAVMAQDAAQTIFTYATDPDADVKAIGWGRKTDNDVAILINNPAYEGFEIIGISVDIPYMEGCSVAPTGKAWLTSELAVDPVTYVNVPDIGTPVESEIINLGTEEEPRYRLDVTFPMPYVIPAEGVYVGYTLTVTALKNSTAKYPMSIASSSNPQGGLYMHAGYSTTLAAQRYQKWHDLAMANEAVSTMRVILRGESMSHGGIIELPAKVFAKQGTTKDLTVEFINYGSENVTSADYTLAIGSESVKGTLNFNNPVATQESAAAIIPLSVPAERGDYAVTLTTDRLNNEENLYANNTSEATLMARPWIPRKRVLVEEYSGLWCEWCPEAYVAMHQLYDAFPGDVVGLAFHVNDQLQTIPLRKMPVPTPNTPEMDFDRHSVLTLYPQAGVMLENSLNTLAPADIDVKLFWTNADKTSLRADSKVKFLEGADDGRYRLSYAFVEDKMTSPKLKQRNSFLDPAAYTADYYKGPYWNLFIGKGYTVEGLEYDDIVLNFDDCKGIEDSLPATVEPDATYTHHTIFNLSDAKCAYSENPEYNKNIIINPGNLRAVAVLIDTTTGNVVNVNTSGYSADAEIYDPATTYAATIPQAEVLYTEYYALNGMRLNSRPASGAYIAVKHLTDGNIITAKYLQSLQ
ncbi:MAG: hypothetical protein K2K29_04600 [Muribaculaceae bacterium]|nr:hypothetical protein [Muribaculaceae bacterium]